MGRAIGFMKRRKLGHRCPRMCPRIERTLDEQGQQYRPFKTSGSDKVRPRAILVQHLTDLRAELALEDAENAREVLRDEQRMHRKEAKEWLDELQPRAEPGTKERQMEKKRELASANRQFALAKEGAGMAEVAEGDMMGDDADGLDGFKRRKKEVERKKNERELKREEIMRARREEREEKARMFQEKERETMTGLIELAKQRYGPG